MYTRLAIELVRDGRTIQSSSVIEGEVAQIPQRKGSTVCLFGDSFTSHMIARFQGKVFSGSVMHFAKDGETKLPLTQDRAGRSIRGHLIEAGKTLEFGVRPGSEVRVLIQAGHGTPPNPPAQVYDALGPTRRGDIVVVRAQASST